MTEFEIGDYVKMKRRNIVGRITKIEDDFVCLKIIYIKVPKKIIPNSNTETDYNPANFQYIPDLRLLTKKEAVLYSI